jgi:hypothetical protein
MNDESSNLFGPRGKKPVPQPKAEPRGDAAPRSPSSALDMLRSVSTEYGLWEMELRIPGAYAKAVRHVIQQTIEKNPDPAVSPHVHVCTVRRGAIEITTSDHNRTWSSGEVTEWRMPPVATTWSEFDTLTRQAFGSGADAVAVTA